MPTNSEDLRLMRLSPNVLKSELNDLDSCYDENRLPTGECLRIVRLNGLHSGRQRNDSNPYSKGTYEYDAWVDGYRVSLRELSGE